MLLSNTQLPCSSPVVVCPKMLFGYWDIGNWFPLNQGFFFSSDRIIVQLSVFIETTTTCAFDFVKTICKVAHRS